MPITLSFFRTENLHYHLIIVLSAVFFLLVHTHTHRHTQTNTHTELRLVAGEAERAAGFI